MITGVHISQEMFANSILTSLKPGLHIVVMIADHACDYVSNKILRLQLHGAIYRPDSFVLMLRYRANLKAISCESKSLNRIVADKSHRVIVA